MSRRKQPPKSTKGSTVTAAGDAAGGDAAGGDAAGDDVCRNWLETSAAASLAVLLLAAGSMVPGESSAEFGGHLVWTLGWLYLLAAPAAVAVLRRWPLAVWWRTSDSLLAAGCIVMAIAAAIGGLSANPRAGWNMAWMWVGAAACYVALRQVLATAASRQTVVAMMLGLTTGLAIHGGLQYAITMPAMVRDYESKSETERVRMLQDMGVDPAPNSPARIQFENRLASTEPYATFALANSLAGVLAPWLVVALAIPWLSNVTHRLTIVGLALAAAMGACLLLTKSRAAFLAVLVGSSGMLVVDFLGERRLGWKLPIAAIVGGAGLLVSAVLAGVLDQEVLTQAALSLAYRWEYWQATLAMIADHPWLGCGSGSFQDYYGEYQAPHASELVADPHNFILELAATGGVFAAALMLGSWAMALATPLVRGPDDAESDRKRATDEDNPPSRGTPAWAGFAGLVLGGVVAMLFGFPPEMMGIAPIAALSGATGLLIATWLRNRFSTLPESEWDAWIRIVAPLALLTCFVNLSAAGGISFWAVLQTVLVLTAICNSTAPNPLRWLPSRGALHGATWAFAMIVLIAVGVHLNGLNPVLAVQQAMFQMQFARSSNEVVQAMEVAAKADHWSPVPHQMLAQERSGRGVWDQKTWQHFRDALKRDQRNVRLWWDLADEQLEASKFGRNPKTWGEAVASYRKAAELSPRGPAWARLAWALHFQPAASDAASAEARAWAERALDWHENHPHQEQQLDHVQLPAGPEQGTISALTACRTLVGGDT